MSQWLSLWITVQHRVCFLYVFVCWLWDNTQIRVEYQTRILNIPLSPPSADAHSQVCSVASVAAVMTTSTPVPGYNTHPSVSIMNSIKGWDEAKLPDCVQKRQFFLLYLHQIDDHNFKLFAQDCFYIYTHPYRQLVEIVLYLWTPPPLEGRTAGTTIKGWITRKMTAAG